MIKKVLFLVVFFWGNIWGQDRGDFYDPFDYNLRNYKGQSGFGVDEKEFQEYSPPPKLQDSSPTAAAGTPKTVITPKNVQIPQNINTMLVNPINQTGTQKKISPNIQNPAVNPLTGEVDMEKVLKAQQEKKLKQEKLKEFRKNQKKKPYEETKFRRMQIIFFLTLPFSGLISYGVVSTYGEYLKNTRDRNQSSFLRFNNSNRRFQNSFEGGLFILTGAISLALLNVYWDYKQVEDYEKAKQSLLLEQIAPEEKQLYPEAYSKNYQFFFTIATKQF